MGSDPHYSSRPLPERSAPASSLTLPGVAELLSSSRPSTNDSIPTHHHLNTNHNHPASRPRFTPDTTFSRPSPPFNASATAPAPSEPLYPVAQSHASQPSPTSSSTSTSPLLSQQQYYSHSSAQSAKAPLLPTSSSSTSEASQSLHAASHSQTATNTQRQDSAITQYIEIPKEDQSTVPPSDHSHYHYHRSPNHSRNSISPKPNSKSTSPSSPHSTGFATHSHPNPVYHQLASYPFQRPYSKSNSTDHFSTEVTRSHELVPPTAASAALHQDLSNGSQSNSSSGSGSNGHTRQQRYNVRFAANHTPDNMPSFPKSRQDRPLSPTTTDGIEHTPSPKEQNTAPTIEPAIQIINAVSHTDDAPHAQSRNREPSVERCAGCGETWSRPLPDSLSDLRPTPAGTSFISPFGQSSLNILTALQQHGKKADAQYDDWKWQHSHCVKNGHGHRGSSPYHPSIGDSLHTRGINGTSQDMGRTDSTTQKRKAEQLSGDDQNSIPKQRKVTVAPPSGATPPAQSSART